MIVERIKQLCSENGLNIFKLEKEIGISNGTIARWATSSPTAENLAKVADRFHVSVDYLMGRSERVSYPDRSCVLPIIRTCLGECRMLRLCTKRTS